jgi:nucleotide-binding universal stress UspA family protein
VRPAPRETAAALAAALGAEIVARADDGAGLVVIGSKPGTAAGRVALSAAAQYLIEMLRCPVLALPHGKELRF